MRRLRGEAGLDHGGYRYTAFGTTVADDAVVVQPLRWKARWWQSLAGSELYDMRARQWSPELGSFLSIDEYAFHNSTTTLWGWPGQNPIRWSDPTGRYAFGFAPVGGLLTAPFAPGGAISAEAGVSAVSSGGAFGALAVAAAAIIVPAAYDILTQLDEFEHPTVTHGQPSGQRDPGGANACVSSGGGTGGGGGGPPRLPPEAGGDEAPDAGRNPLRFNNAQLGRKFGEHKSDQPGYQTHEQYRELANAIHNDPSAGISSASNGDTLYQVGNNILRVAADGSFRSVYPIW